MSVYIPDMEMPKNCHDCRFCGWSNFWQSYDCHMTDNRALLLFNGEKTNSDSRTRNGRADNCPLVHVPEHGDLIDRDALSKSLDALCDRVCQYSKTQRKVMCGACPLGDAFAVVEDDVPTIIPAEEGE